MGVSVVVRFLHRFFGRSTRNMSAVGGVEGEEGGQRAAPPALNGDVLPDPFDRIFDSSVHARPLGLRMGMLLPDCFCPVCGTQAIREGRANPGSSEGLPVWFLYCAACQEKYLSEEMELYGEYLSWCAGGGMARGLPSFLLRAFEDLKQMPDPYIVLRRRLCLREPALARVPPVLGPERVVGLIA